MSTYKLSPLEKLRLEKKRLREERDIANRRLVYQLQYLNDNWGSMLTKGVSSSVRSRIAETIDNLSGRSSSSRSMTPFFTKRLNPWLNFTLNYLPVIGPLTWRVAKPALIAFVARKISSRIFRRKKS
jgi:hypothetical protein